MTTKEKIQELALCSRCSFDQQDKCEHTAIHCDLFNKLANMSKWTEKHPNENTISFILQSYWKLQSKRAISSNDIYVDINKQEENENDSQENNKIKELEDEIEEWKTKNKFLVKELHRRIEVDFIKRLLE